MVKITSSEDRVYSKDNKAGDVRGKSDSSKQDTNLAVGTIALLAIGFGFWFFMSGGDSANSDNEKKDNNKKEEMQLNVQLQNNALLVENTNEFSWKTCTLEINSTFDITSVTLGDQNRFALSEFTDDRGKRFNVITHEVNDLYIQCEEPHFEHWQSVGN